VTSVSAKSRHFTNSSCATGVEQSCESGSRYSGPDVTAADSEDDRVRAEDLTIDIAFDINVASDPYISPRVVTAGSLADPVWRTTLFVQTVTREGVPL